MKTTRPLLAAAVLTVLAACTEHRIEEARVPVTLACNTVQDASEATRAAQNLNEGVFAPGESVKVRISNTGEGQWVDYTFTTAAEGALTAPDPAPYYPAGEQNIDIAAYYPATAGTSFTVATDQTADDSYKASDLMFAFVPNQEKTSQAVNLAFSHKLAKLCVNITAGDGVTSITSISLLQVKPTVTFDPATGEVGEASGAVTSIAVSNQGAVVIPAQTITGDLFSIVTDQGTVTYSVPAGKAFEAGNYYTMNITVAVQPEPEEPLFEGALLGKFTIDKAGHKVIFSRGNLQATYNGSSWTWAFAEHQWDYIGGRNKYEKGAKTGNNYIKIDGTMSNPGTIDLFGWVGASSTWTDEARLHGITSSSSTNATDGYGNSTSDFLKSDWGNLPIVNGGGAAGSGWHTLTGDYGGEWEWLLGPIAAANPGTNCRKSSTVNGTSNARFAKATVAGTSGLIIFPDSYTHPKSVTAPDRINDRGANYNVNSYDADAWAKMESAGCVFLPAAGIRGGKYPYVTVDNVGADGNYWSSSPGTRGSMAINCAYCMPFTSGDVNPVFWYQRFYGLSVRLVRRAE